MNRHFDRSTPPGAKRSLGQNFLIDQNIVHKLMRLAAFDKGDTIVELGVGRGALTRVAARHVSRVIGIEKDRELLAWLKEHGDLPKNVDIRQGDMLEVSYKALSHEIGSRLKLMGNLPYNISTPLLFKLIDERSVIEEAILMFQKEVAERLTASPGTKAYGVLSVVVQKCASVDHLMDVPPLAFRPVPKVASSVVRIRFKQDGLDAEEFSLFRALVKKAFQKRRKVLPNSLEGFMGLGKGEIRHILQECGLDPGLRPEDLSVHDFQRLAGKLGSAIKNGDIPAVRGLA